MIYHKSRYRNLPNEPKCRNCYGHGNVREAKLPNGAGEYDLIMCDVCEGTGLKTIPWTDIR